MHKLPLASKPRGRHCIRISAATAAFRVRPRRCPNGVSTHNPLQGVPPVTPAPCSSWHWLCRPSNWLAPPARWHVGAPESGSPTARRRRTQRCQETPSMHSLLLASQPRGRRCILISGAVIAFRARTQRCPDGASTHNQLLQVPPDTLIACSSWHRLCRPSSWPAPPAWRPVDAWELSSLSSAAS